jgi:hypothetical protein
MTSHLNLTEICPSSLGDRGANPARRGRKSASNTAVRYPLRGDVLSMRHQLPGSSTRRAAREAGQIPAL